jgi:hypothetical protein
MEKVIALGIDPNGVPRPILVNTNGEPVLTGGSVPLSNQVFIGGVVLYGIDSNGNPAPIRVDTTGHLELV